jgi:hypothetical protein
VADAQQAQFSLGKQHFPYFLSGRTLTVSHASIFIQPSGLDHVDTTGLKITLNNTEAGTWITAPPTSLSTADVAVSGPAVTSWAIKATGGPLNPSTVADILLLFKYSIT